MIRNLKAMGLALVAVFAMSAMSASAASAQSFNADSYPAILSGVDLAEPKNAFTTNKGSVECTNSTYSGKLSASATSVTINATYHSCGLKTVSMNGCDYVFHASGTVDLECPVGAQVEVSAYSSSSHEFRLCRILIPQQTGLKSVTYTNISEGGTTDHVIIEGTVEGISYTSTGLCGHESATNGVYHVNVKVTGKNEEGKHVGIDVS